MALSIHKLSDHTGAEAVGVDLSRPIDSDTRARLNQAFVEHSVLAVRGQSLTPPQVLEGVRRVGLQYVAQLQGRGGAVGAAKRRVPGRLQL